MVQTAAAWTLSTYPQLGVEGSHNQADGAFAKGKFSTNWGGIFFFWPLHSDPILSELQLSVEFCQSVSASRELGMDATSTTIPRAHRALPAHGGCIHAVVGQNGSHTSPVALWQWQEVAVLCPGLLPQTIPYLGCITEHYRLARAKMGWVFSLYWEVNLGF